MSGRMKHLFQSSRQWLLTFKLHQLLNCKTLTFKTLVCVKVLTNLSCDHDDDTWINKHNSSFKKKIAWVNLLYVVKNSFFHITPWKRNGSTWFFPVLLITVDCMCWCSLAFQTCMGSPPTSGHILSPQRSRMSPENLNMLTFLHHNLTWKKA